VCKRISEDVFEKVDNGLQFRLGNAVKMQNKEKTMDPEKGVIVPFFQWNNKHLQYLNDPDANPNANPDPTPTPI